MTRVVVVGGGLGGMAVAARLAKLGHAVTLCEASDRLGGALRPVERDGFVWDGGAASTLLPAVLRDLFRKTGRPLERELHLVPLQPIREHRFTDGSRLALPGGSRAAQLRAFDGLGAGLGAAWAAYVAGLAVDWELVRRDYLERPYDPATADRAATVVLRRRLSLGRLVEQALPDERLRLVALHHVRAEGQDPARVPAWVGVWSYLEQRLGAATVPGGLSAVAAALERRLETRGVEVRLSTPVTRLLVDGGRARGVATAAEELASDATVVACDPSRFRALSRHVRRTTPVPAPTVVHLGVTGDLDLAHETVLHGGPDLVLHRGGSAPAGHAVLTVAAHRPPATSDLVDLLADRGIDLRERVVSRVDRSAGEVGAGGSPYGVAWEGRATVSRRLGPRTPIAGLFAAGAHATPGGGVPFVGLSAALVAQVVGPAPGR
ncbi:phytoene desaturase family protein [Nocardioides sp.]|uniref:phytoene desaturase family protein n=1 Tax=Nocardioides sp. TaxID=35761 RepID=UPI003529AC17